MNRKSRTVKIWLLALSLTILTAVSAFFIASLFPLQSRRIPFSASDWKDHQYKRPRMVDDLLSRNLLLGKSPTEVKKMLGTPQGRDIIDDNKYIYWAGTSMIDDQWLEISFQNDQVVEVRTYPD